MEALLTKGVFKLSRALFASLPCSLGNDMQHGVKPLSSGSKVFIIRQDAYEKDKFSVYDTEGNTKYTIGRNTPHSSQWSVYSMPDMNKVASLSIGCLQQNVYLIGKSKTLTLRHNDGGVLDMLHRHFYDAKGNMYSWNRRSHYLERISNPSGTHEEHRERVAFVNQLRNGKFDWEILVDTNAIGELKVISTAFIALKTQLSSARKGLVPGALIHASMLSGSAAKPSKTEAPLAEFTGNDPQKLRIFQRRDTLLNAREFFNPPSFLKGSP